MTNQNNAVALNLFIINGHRNHNHVVKWRTQFLVSVQRIEENRGRFLSPILAVYAGAVVMDRG